MEPSFFSIAQSAGLLNPGQSVNIGLMFKPATPGQHNATLTLSSVSVRGGQETGVPSSAQTPVTVMLSGSGAQVRDVTRIGIGHLNDSNLFT